VNSRSLMIIGVMGIVSMVALTMSGSFFVGKLGGADSVLGLRKDISQIFANQMDDPKALKIKVRLLDKKPGLVLEYAPDAELADDDRALSFHMKRVADYILGQRAWRSRAAFVTLRLSLPNGKTVEKRYVRAPDPA